MKVSTKTPACSFSCAVIKATASKEFTVRRKTMKLTNWLTVVFTTVMMMVSFVGEAQVLVENFSYISGSTLLSNGWAASSGTGTNNVTVNGAGLSYSAYTASGIGLGVPFTNNGEDVNKTFTAITSGSIYASFLVNISAAQSTGDYFAGLTTSGPAFAARISVKSTAGGYFFGLGKGNQTIAYEANLRTFATTYLVVVKYTYSPAANDDVISLWVNPVINGAEGAATLSTATGTADAAASGINGFFIRQGSATAAASGEIDGIKAGTSWLNILPVPPVITSALTASGMVGTPIINYTIDATNGPTAYTASPLPAGLSLAGNLISGTPTTVSVVNVALSATNAAGTDNKTLVFTIDQGSQAITGLPSTDSRVYGAGSYNLAATGGASGFPVTYTSSDPLVASISGNTVTIVGAGETTITASQAGDANWAAATDITQLLTVTKANQAITFGPLEDKLDTDPAFNVTGSSNSGLTVSFASSNPSVATISGNTVTITGPGTTVITASQPGNTNYNAAADVPQNQLVVNSSLQNQTITFNVLPNKTYGDAAFQLTATGGGSGNPVTYTSSNTSVATISGDMVTMIAPGTTNITASQAGNVNYNAALDVVQSFTVEPKTLTVTGAIAQDKIYDGNTAAVISGAVPAGVINADDVTITGGGIFADANVATGITVTGNLSLNGADASKYTLTQPTGLSADITVASQTITGLAATNTKAYGDAPYNLAATGGGSGNAVTYISSNPLVAAISGNTVSITGAGTTTITASQAGNSNYTAAIDVVQELTVSQQAQVITFLPLANKLSTDLPFVLTAASSTGGAISYSSSNPAVATVSGSTVTILSAGSTVITASQPGNTNIAPATPVQQTQLVVPVLAFAPVPMAAQPGKAYTQNFNDIATWGNGFASGFEANRWKGLAAAAGTPPAANITTSATATFVSGTSGGVQRGSSQTIPTTDILLLATGGTDNTSSAAIDFYMDFTGEIADKLSFNAATVFNVSGDRGGTLRVYASIDGTTWTELTGTNLPYLATNFIAHNAAISNIQLPASFNNNANARLRFYYHNATGGASGSRPKISIDDLTVSALLAPVINSTLTATATVGSPFSYNITAAHSPTSYNATGLPSPLSVNPGTGIIDGTPGAVGAGTYNISIEATNALGTDTKTLVLTILPGAQAISFAPLPAKVYGDVPFSLTGTASSGLAVTYASSDPSVATISGSTVTIVGVGTTIITASQAGDASWNAASPVTQSLLVNKADQTITFAALPDKADTDIPFNLTASASSGLTVTYASSNSAVATIAGNTVTITGPGTTIITASQAGDANFNPAADVTQSQFVVNTNLTPQLITFNALSNSVYGDVPFQLTATGGGSGNPVTYVSSNTAVATIAGDMVTIIAPGTTNITASQAGDMSYNPATDVVQPLTVDPKVLTVIGAAAQDKLYDGNTTAVITGPALVGVITPDVVTVSGGGTFADANVASAIAVTANLSLGGLDASKYILTQPTGLSAAITIAGQSITFNGLPAKTTADIPFALTAIASSGLPVTYSSSNPAVATISGNMVTITGVGTTIITASQAGDGNYNAATAVPQNLVVSQGSQTINFTALSPKMLGDPAFALAGTASSGLTVSYTSSNPAVAGIAGNTVTITGSGSTIITASQAGNVNFAAAVPVPQTLTVTQSFEPVPMAAQPLRTYTENFTDIGNWLNNFAGGNGANRWKGIAIAGGTVPDPAVTTTATTTFNSGTSGGVQRGSSQTPAVAAIVLVSTGGTDNSSSAAVDFYMDFTGLIADKLSFEASTIVNTPANNKYGTLRVYASVNGTTWTELTGTNLPYITTNAAAATSGINNIQLPVIFNNNANARLRFYYHNGGLAAGTGNRPKISIDNLTVSALNSPVITSALAANGTVDASFSYIIAATNTPTSYNATGLPPGLTFSGNTISGTATVAGTFNVTLEATNAGGTDTKTLIVTIAKADQVIIGLPASDTKNYGDAAYNLSATGGASGLPVTYTSSDPLVATVSGNSITITGGGITIITASQAGNADYNAATDVAQTLTVNKINQTITFAALPNKADTDIPFNLTASASSGLMVTYASSNSAVATITGNTVTITGPGTTIITASQAGDANYNPAADVTQNQLVLNSSLPAQVITFNALANSVYGDAPFQLTATGGGSGNPVTYVSSNTAVATITGDMVTIIAPGTTNITASQAGDMSYNPATDVVQPLTVDPKVLTVIGAAAQDKLYDGNTTAVITGPALVGVITPDVVTVSGGGTFADANVASAIAVTANLSLGGLDASKYILTQPTGLSAAITIAGQSITFNGLPAKTLGDAPFALTAIASSGLPVTYSSSNPAVATISGNIVTITGDGTTVITALQSGNANYSPATGVAQSQLVNAPLSIVTWNFGTGSGNAAPSGVVPAGLSVSPVSQGNNNGTTGLLSNLNASNTYPGFSAQYNAAASALNGSLSITTSTYFEFTLSPIVHKKVTLNSISFGSRSSTAGGPVSYNLRSSLDNFATGLATGVMPNDNAWGLRSPVTTASTSAYGAAVTYRIYGYDGTGGAANTANWRIDDLNLSLLLESAPACTGTPTAGTAVAGTGTFCINGSTTITLSGYTDPVSVDGISLQWYSSTDNITFNIIPAETNALLSTGTITQTMYYYCAVSCLASGLSANSNTVTVTVNQAANAGTVGGTTTLCIGGTAAYTTNGDGGGIWSSTDPAVATVDALGTVTAVSGGTSAITYTVTGCSGPDSDFLTVTVNESVNAGTVSGLPSLCEGSSTNYTTTGDAGGTWSSSDPTVATVNTLGVVTAVNEGTTNITYTISSGCFSPAGAFQQLIVNAVPAAPSVSVLNNMNGTSTLTAAGYTGSLLWSTNEITASITVAAAGPYTVTQTVNGCTSLPGTGVAAPVIIADPAVTGLDITDISDVPIPDANATPLSQLLKLKVPVFNLNQVNIVPAGSTTMRIDLGSKFIVDPGFTLSSASLNTYFDWTETVEAGNVVIYGNQIADIPADFDAVASFQIIANTSCSSQISANIIADNHASTVLSLSDEDAANNIATLQYTIVVPAAVASVIQPTCSSSTGTITISSPLVAGMTYSLNGIDYSNTTGVFTSVPAGSYNVTVKTVDGCISAITIVVVDPQPATPTTIIYTIMQPDCTTPTGTITITSPVGSGLTYSIDGVDYSNTSGIFTNLAPGSYNLTAAPVAGCVSTITVATVNPQPAFSGTITFNVTQPDCTTPTGTITITDPTAPGMTYSIDGIDYSNTTGEFEGLTPGSYNLTVKTDAGCISPVTISTINAGPAIPTITLGTVTSTGCSGSPVGSISVTAGGGPGPFTFTIAGPTVNTTGATSGVFTGLSAGNYVITVLGPSGCTNSINAVVVGPTGISPDITLGADYSDNFFFAVGSVNTIVYNVSEIAGNPAVGDTIRITKVPGYTISFNPSLTANPVGITPLDNPRWKLVNSAAYVSLILDPAHNNTPGTLNCGERVYIAVNVLRTTPNISIFSLSARLRQANNESYLLNNSNTILFFSE